MTPFTLLLRSLRSRGGEHTLTALAVAVAAAVLTGALVVGDSLTATLGNVTADRLGRIGAALDSGDRLFSVRWADALRQRLAPSTVSAVLALAGTAENTAGTVRAGAVQVLGIDDHFGKLVRDPRGPEWQEGVFINTALAARLGVQSGDEILVRVEKPGRVSRDMALASGADTAVAFRERVQAVLADDAGGRFSLRNVHGSALTVFLPRARLQQLVDAPGQANMVLCEAGLPDAAGLAAVVRDAWQPADVGLEVWDVPERNAIELRSRQVFMDDTVGRAAMAVAPQGTRILTYMVNAVRHGERSTPYSFVCGTEGPAAGGLASNEIAVTDWLADDLGLAAGAQVCVDYYVMGAARTLVETSAVFRVGRILPLATAGDASLMPNIPGVAETGSCRDWHSGLPIDLKAIRPKDEAYWDQWRGSPKAFVTLATAQEHWATPWGQLTAVRWPSSATTSAAVERELRDRLTPESFGLVFRDVAEEGRRSVAAATDFRQLFLGLSMFLIAAALMLIGQLSRLTLERREAEAGLLMSAGAGGPLTAWLLMESAVIAMAGAALGAIGGLGYAWVMIEGLSRFWSHAVAGLKVVLAVRTGTLALAWSLTVLLALGVMALGIRAVRRRTVHGLLSGTRDEACVWRSRGWAVTTLTAWSLAFLLWGSAWWVEERQRAGLFFGVGGLALTGLCAALGWRLLQGAGTRGMAARSIARLGFSEAGRHPARSVLVAGLMSLAVFVLVTLAINTPPEPSRYERGSATGGFAWVMETALPIHANLDRPAEQSRFGLDAADMGGVSFVGLRIHRADDASCLNLARAQDPQVAGVDPRSLAVRGAFRFVRTEHATRPAAADGWALLSRVGESDVVPAIADAATMTWGLGVGVGDELSVVDGQGRPFRLRFVGMIETSILQGMVLIDERRFAERYPGDTGYRAFLVDTPPARAEAAGARLTHVFRREGAACVSTVERAGEFAAVTIAYLAMFRTIGGLGVLLGVAGLAIILARHGVERRGELALLRAVGFRRSQVVRLLVSEQVWLMAAGLAGGGAAALLATLPSLQRLPDAGPLEGSAGWAALVFVTGLVATWATALITTRGMPFEGLRKE